MVVEARTGAAITPAKLEAFSQLMREKLDTADAKARKAYLQSVIARVEVDDQKIRVLSDRAALAAAAAGQNTNTTKVRGFVRNWRSRRDSNSRPLPAGPLNCICNTSAGLRCSRTQKPDHDPPLTRRSSASIGPIRAWTLCAAFRWGSIGSSRTLCE